MSTAWTGASMAFKKARVPSTPSLAVNVSGQPPAAATRAAAHERPPHPAPQPAATRAGSHPFDYFPPRVAQHHDARSHRPSLQQLQPHPLPARFEHRRPAAEDERVEADAVLVDQALLG